MRSDESTLFIDVTPLAVSERNRVVSAAVCSRTVDVAASAWPAKPAESARAVNANLSLRCIGVASWGEWLVMPEKDAKRRPRFLAGGKPGGCIGMGGSERIALMDRALRCLVLALTALFAAPALASANATADYDPASGIVTIVGDGSVDVMQIFEEGATVRLERVGG